MAVYEITFKSGVTVSFKAKMFALKHNFAEWESYEGQEQDKLVRIAIDEIVAVVQRKG